MRWFYNIILYSIFFNIAVYVIQAFNLTPVSMAPNYDLNNLSTIFNIDVFRLQFTGETLVAAAGGAALLLVSLLTRQNTYALYALVIWAVGVLIVPIQDFIYAIPNAINDIIGKTSLNPLWDGTITYAGTNPYSLIFAVIFQVGAFFFLMEVVLQRPLT